MTGFAETFGYGTDPEGDAARREREGVVELPDGTRVAGVPEPALPAVAARLALPPGTDLAASIRRTAHLVPPSPAEVEEVLGAEVVADLDRDRILAGHEVEVSETRGGLGWARCACGDWEAVVTGQTSAAWAFASYEEHLRRIAASLGE